VATAEEDRLTMKKLLLAGVAALLLATGTAHAGDLAAYRKPICETAEDFAGCMANKKPQMWTSDRLRWDCRHGFSFIARDDGGNDHEIGDEEVDFIVTITKTPTYKACKAYQKCVSGETKEKHCYINDKRWRGFHTGWW
jgi:hypothetical protein